MMIIHPFGKHKVGKLESVVESLRPGLDAELFMRRT